MRYLLDRIIFVVFVVLLLAFVLPAAVEAQDENQTKIDKAYEWLSERVNVRWGNTEENAFSVMALKNYNSSLAGEGVENLLSNSKNGNGECWPAGSCKVKDTALALIALAEMDGNTSSPKEWLLSQQGLFIEQGQWFLQFEIGENNGTCNVEYDTNKDTISVKEDRTVDVSGSSCFDILPDKPWWVHIKLGCLEKEFFVSCEETEGSEWLSNILFIAGNVYVPFPEVRSEGHLQINSRCFPTAPGGSCDYESTLWASYALSLVGENAQTRAFLEFGADGNKPLSYALIFLTNGELDFAQKVSDEQKTQGFWDGTDAFFHTAIAYLSQRDTGGADLDAASGWLLDNQNSDFSWGSANKHRDTAAVLFSAFPSGVQYQSTTTQRCEDFSGFICCPSSQITAGAQTFDRSCAPSFDQICVGVSDCEIAGGDEICGVDAGICCEIASMGATFYYELDDTCSFGEVCASSCEVAGEERCIDVGECCEISAIGSTRYSNLDSSCGFGEVCASSCEVPFVPQLDTCFDVGGICCGEAASGATRYDEYDDTCSSGEVCASECETEKPAGGNFLTFLLWFLGILVVVAIIVLVYMLMKKRKKRPEKLPGLAGVGSGRYPPAAPPRIPVFKRPATPRGPPIIPSRRLGPASPMRSRLPALGARVRPRARHAESAAKPAKVKTHAKQKGKAETELEKTLKELEGY